MTHQTLIYRFAYALSQMRAFLFSVLLLPTLALASLPGHAATSSGLWTGTAGDYLALLQDANSGTTLAVQLAADLSSVRVFTGVGTSTTISLKSLTNTADTLATTYTESSMSGTQVLSGVSAAYSAKLALAWVANENAGVWQKSTGSNAYLLFFLLNTGGVKLGVQIDLTLNTDKTYTYDVFTGTLSSSNIFTGASLLNPGLTSRLTFTAPNLSATTTTTSRPPVTSTYTATQIIQISS